MALGSGLDVKLHPDGDMYGSMTHAQAINMVCETDSLLRQL